MHDSDRCSRRLGLDALLAPRTVVLRADARFVAAWLIGGNGRADGPPDAFSDVTSWPPSGPRPPPRCARPWEVCASNFAIVAR